MSNISNPSLAAGLSPRQNALTDAQFSSYVRKQSVTARESLDAGLSITTKEGDLVTLTASSYAEIDAFLYDSKGVVQTGSGTALVTQNQREITLASGESFSFSVTGDLSEEELADIEAIVKGIDDIISEMAQGDMDDALDKALSMGGYETVSMYSADLTYQKSYALASETRTEAVKTMPPNEMPATDEKEIPPEKEAPGRHHRPGRRGNHFLNNMDQFIEKMARELEAHDKEMVEKARKPIDKLFRHHMSDHKGDSGEETPIYNTIENAGKQILAFMDKMAGGIFKENLSAFFK